MATNQIEAATDLDVLVDRNDSELNTIWSSRGSFTAPFSEQLDDPSALLVLVWPRHRNGARNGW